MKAIKSANELPADFGSIEGCCPDPRDKRIAELEARISTAGALASQKASHDMIIDALCGRLNIQQ